MWLNTDCNRVDLVVPDLVPFADEILLGLGTLLLANWKDRGRKPG